MAPSALRLILIFLLIPGSFRPIPAQEGGSADLHPRDSVGWSSAARSTLNRPRIALVLSGGGAKGAAHLGVLKVLERLRIPVDFIVGTSMGAIIGGLYAAGLSPSEMEEILQEIDWKDLFDDRPPDLQLTFRQKQNRDQFGRLEVGLKKGSLALPRGLFSGQKLSFLLKSLTLHTIGIEHFDDLPVPFRAVATDLRTGDLVVLERGGLAEAIRASMSVPGVFTPVEVGGKLLVDGGVVNNFPVDVACEWGAEIVIAVSVSGIPELQEQFDSVLDITVQVVDLVTRRNLEKQLARLDSEDVFIRIDTGHSASDFAASAEIIRRGESAAEAMSPELSRYSLSPWEYAEYLESQRRRSREPATVDFIRVESAGNVSPKRVRARIRTRPGDKLDLEQLRKDIERIYALGYFQSVDFEVVEDGGQHGLVFRATEKPWGPNYLRIGFNISEDFQGGGSYLITTEYLMTQLNQRGGEWRSELQIGKTLGASTEFYQPLDFHGRFYLLPSIQAGQSISDVYEEETRTGQYRVFTLESAVYIGTRLGTSLETLGGLVGWYKAAGTLIGDEELPEINSILVGYQGLFIFDRIDDLDVPKKGTLAGLDLLASRKYLGSDESFEQLEAELLTARTLGRLSMLFSVGAGTTFEEKLPLAYAFGLGGFLSFSGYRPGQLSGFHYERSAIISYIRLSDIEAAWGNAFYLGGSFETAGGWLTRKEIRLQDLLLGGSVFLALDTAIGPLYFAYGFAEGRRFGNLYLFLGQVF